jgi:hypothetical protein
MIAFGTFAHPVITRRRTTIQYNAKRLILSEISACYYKNSSIFTQISSGKPMVSPSDMVANTFERPIGIGATATAIKTAEASPSRILKIQVSLASYRFVPYQLTNLSLPSANNISKGSTDLNRIFACWTKAVNILDANIEQQEHKWEQHKGSEQPALWLDSHGEWDQTKMSMLKDILGFKADVS